MARSTISEDKVLKRLDEARLEYAVVPVSETASVLCLRRGGRILGPFRGEDPGSELWLNDAFRSRAAFRAFLRADEWNLGGDRIWISPEYAFNARDRFRFFETYDLPATMDPGNYVLESGESEAVLFMDFVLKAHTAGFTKQYFLQKVVRSAANPLRGVPSASELIDQVEYAGYEQLVRLRDRNPELPLMVQAWSIMQLNPQGVLTVPCTRGVRATDYFEPAPESHMRVRRHCVEFVIDGQRRYKVGLSALNVLGRFGYLRRVGKSLWSLVVRGFFCNPSSEYVEGPVLDPAHSGDAFHVYNDGGNFGGFGEMECHSETIGAETGRTEITAGFPTWFFRGDKPTLRKVAGILLGC